MNGAKVLKDVSEFSKQNLPRLAQQQLGPVGKVSDEEVGGGGGSRCRVFACQLRRPWMAGRWRTLGGASHLSGPVGCAEIGEVPFTSNRKNPVNIQLFNNPECAAHGAFWRLWGLHFPLMYFHCQTLYLKSSKMELVTFSLFSFIQSNLKGFQQYFSSPRCFVVLGWGGSGGRGAFKLVVVPH